MHPIIIIIIIIFIIIGILCVCFTREISAELDKLTAVLEKLHAKIAGKYDDVSYLEVRAFMEAHAIKVTHFCSLKE